MCLVLVFVFVLGTCLSGISQNYSVLRNAMVDKQLKARGIKSEAVLAAMRKVERHRFVPKNISARAYDDSALPIGEGQTISQPYIVAFMTEALNVEPQTGYWKLVQAPGTRRLSWPNCARKYIPLNWSRYWANVPTAC